MASCCQAASRAIKYTASCLARCDLPKHTCLDKEDVQPGPVPKHMGWRYTAKNAPEHQLRCGWRPGHISCPVLRKIEAHNCRKAGDCTAYTSASFRPSSKPCCVPSKCLSFSPSTASCCKQPPSVQTLIRIIRHDGNYTICTEPTNSGNAPSGPYPLKYVLNTDSNELGVVGSTEPGKKKPAAKYSVEAKYNDYNFDYTSSQSSFVLDFSPPDCRPPTPCVKRNLMRILCKTEDILCRKELFHVVSYTVCLVNGYRYFNKYTFINIPTPTPRERQPSCFFIRLI